MALGLAATQRLWLRAMRHVLEETHLEATDLVVAPRAG